MKEYVCNICMVTSIYMQNWNKKNEQINYINTFSFEDSDRLVNDNDLRCRDLAHSSNIRTLNILITRNSVRLFGIWHTEVIFAL